MFNFSFFDHRFFRSRAFAYREFFKELDAYRRKSRFAHQTREDSKNYHDFYVELQGKSKEPEAELFYQTLIDRTQMELDFHDGKWVNLTFDPGFSNWSANSVNWTYESPTSATASNQREWTQMQMYHFSDFPGPKEVMAEVELVAKGSGSIGVGLTIGPMNGVEGGRLFYIDPIKNKRGVTSNCERSDGAALKHWESESIVKSSKLHLKFWSPEQFAFYTDGYIFQIKSDSDFLQDGGDDRFKIGLGERQNRSDNGVVRFKSVRVRKLDIQPPPKGENERSLKYYQEAIEREPGYFSHHRMKGNACFALERYDEVEIAYRIASEMRPMDLLLAHDYGDCLTRLGKFQAALEQFSKVCKDDKAHYRSASTSIMAMIYASAPDDSLLDAERAISLAEDSMKLAGKNTSSINFLGLGLAQGANGDFDSAIKSLNESKEVAAEKYHVRLIESAISAFEKGKPFKLPVPE